MYHIGSIPQYLKNGCAILEVGEGLHNVLIEDLDGFLPVSGEPSYKLLKSALVHLDLVPLTSLQERFNVLDKVDDSAKIRGESLGVCVCVCV